MKSIIEQNLASKPARWLVDDDDHVIAWAGRTFVSLAYADEEAACDAARRVPQQPCTAIGP